MPDLSERDEANVLVTGMGPFMDFDQNASYLIADSLPSMISPSQNRLSNLRRINLIIHRPAIRTSYHDVRSQVPKFFAEHRDVDFVLHMGIAYPRQYYTIETQSYRDDYNTFPDVDGKYARDLKDIPGGERLWKDTYHAPKILKSALRPADDLWRRTQSLLLSKASEADVRLSDNPGNYLCGFIYYAGLVERWRKGENANVLFLHTKGETDEDSLQEGREVAMAVIRAAVEIIEIESRKKADGISSKGCQCVVS